MHILERLPNLGVTKVNKEDKHKRLFLLRINVWRHRKFFIIFEPCKSKVFVFVSKTKYYPYDRLKPVDKIELTEEKYDILLRSTLITLYKEEKIGHIELSEELKNSKDYKEALEWYTYYKNKLKLNRYI